MAVGQGFSKVVTSGSVFHYDTGDVINSFKGKPTTNLLLDIGYTYGTQNQTYFKSNYGTEYDIIPGLGGQVLVNYCNFFNDYNGGSGNCCPSVFYYGNFTVSPSTVYTYQIVYKTPDGYANANYMYHYEFGPGGYVTEYGLWSDTRTQDLGNGWVHAWGTFTSNAATNYFQTYLFHYQYTQTKIQIAGVMLTQGDVIIPPRQFIPVNTTRSNTQGLLDLTGNCSLDLSNVTFNTNGNITFDGTNDYINIPSSNVFDTQTVTVEVVVKPYATSQNGFWFEKGAVNTQYSLFMEGGNIVWRQAGNSQYTSTSTLTNNAWNHVVGTFKSGERITYVNGTTRTSDGLVYTLNTNQGNQFIGSYNAGGYYYNGEIAVVRVYNRVLPAGEILQNYNHYKTRFNLP
jgi:hypothetical protein